MDPVIGVSVARINPSRWLLGSLMVCEKSDILESTPSDAISHWKDGNNTFCLRKKLADDPELSTGDSQVDRIHAAGTSAASWCLGQDTFVKVHSWIEGLEMEAEKIQFVTEKAPEVPVPEVIYTWIDRDLNRSFLIMKRVEGQTLDKAWPKLSPPQRTQIADDVARFSVTLAANTSTLFETVTGLPVSNERWLMDETPASHLTWHPKFLGPLTQEGMQTYLAKISNATPPDIEPEFHFYHADLGPTNIMVSGDGRLSGIIDWESAAYYPRFWLATKPLISWAFLLDCEEGEDSRSWARLLAQGLETHGGFKGQAEAYKCWHDGVRKQ
ncbi:kinase-like domain-containing protein [Chaetomium tenue]|uniref:Kinase-like domain-containing protein n=1 Tax=Chaetomium tenue TaxID=1854479 RepID=A0ACB7PRX7_9PEZI|nr:kinase-like domain-containing protein [Chaetomium globosum]